MKPHGLGRAPIDVIVPVHNQFEILRDCLHSVMRSDCKPHFELSVIGDGSTDPSVTEFLGSLAAGSAIQLYKNSSNLGFTKSVNFGMKLHPERDVVLLNSDVIVYEGWLDRIAAAAYSGPRIASVNPMTSQLLTQRA